MTLNIRNDANQDGTLDITGEIVAEKSWFTSGGAVVAREFREALKSIRNVTVHINSPGGDVMAGAEIYSALREHSLSGAGKVTVIITALAASAASIVAMAGDRILISPAAYMMIHNPWTLAVGDSRELRKTAKTLDVIAEGLIETYRQRTGKDRDELEKMLDAETWMSAATCVEEGFADEIFGAQEGGQSAALQPVKMSAKAHGAQEIAARLRDICPEDPGEPDPEPEAPAPGPTAEELRAQEEQAIRRDIAARAAVLAGVYAAT